MYVISQHTGAVVSTTTALLVGLALFVLFALSRTFDADNLNVLLQAAFAVYVNSYVTQFSTLQVIALSLNVTTLFVCAIAPLVKLIVLIKDQVSIHLNTTFHVLYHSTNDIGLFVGCTLIVHSGRILSMFVTSILHDEVFHATSLIYHVYIQFNNAVFVFEVVKVIPSQLYLAFVSGFNFSVTLSFVRFVGFHVILHVGAIVSNRIESYASFGQFHKASLYCTRTVL